MNKFFDLLCANYIRVFCVLLYCFFVYAAHGCEPTTRSLLTPNLKVTRNQLQIELESIKRDFELRSANLEEQERLRQFILQNALMIAQQGTINPIGLLTGLAAFYGVGSATNSVVKSVKTKKNNSLSP